MQINIIKEDNYGAAYTHKKTGFTTKYYTKKQMAALQNTLTDSQGHGLPIRRHYQITPATAVIGYVRIKDDIFVAIVRNVAVKRLTIAVLGIALLTFGAWCAVNWYDWFPAKIDIDPNAVVMNPDNNTPTHDQITIPGYTVIQATKDGQTKWSLQNPEGNPCYFQVTLKLEDSNRKLYQSGLLPPGTAVENPELETHLDPGTYNVLIQYSTYELEGAHNPMNSASTVGQLIIQ